MKRFIYFVIIFVMAQISVLNAQDNIPPQGTWGFRASIQGSQTDIMAPYRASDNVTISPIFGFRWDENAFTNIRFGGHAQIFRNTGTDFATYVGGQLVIDIFSPDVGDSETDVLIGGNAGGEYFISGSFSLGVEGRLNLLLNGATSIRTATAVTATYYF